MVGVANQDPGSAIHISIYNLLSGTHTRFHHAPEGKLVAPIWTHGECLRLVTVKPGSVTVWEVGFTSTHMPTEIESLPTPGDISDLESPLFLPNLSRLAFIHRGKVLIWDARDSKLLLDYLSCGWDADMSFSSDGRFFVCRSGTINRDIRLWKESPAGYTLHRQLVSGIGPCIRQLLSPDGESIIGTRPYETQLWRTTDPISSLSSVPTPTTGGGNFILEFSPDGSLAATARRRDNTVTVLDINSGNPRLIIDTGMDVYGLRVTRNSVIVVGDGMIITWNLPAGDHVLDARATVDDSARTITFNGSAPRYIFSQSATISSDLSYVVTIRGDRTGLDVYDMSTGNHLAGTNAKVEALSQITSDGCEAWSLEGWPYKGWKIIKDENSDVIELEPLPENAAPSGRHIYRSPHGHGIADDGWIFDSRGKLLMWLPQRWRERRWPLRWDGRFLGLSDDGLPEPVIIELYE